MAHRTLFRFVEAYGDSAAAFSTTTNWAAEFKSVCTTLADDFGKKRPKVENTVEKIHDLILENQPLKLQEVAMTVGIKKEWVCYIFMVAAFVKGY